MLWKWSFNFYRTPLSYNSNCEGGITGKHLEIKSDNLRKANRLIKAET